MKLPIFLDFQLAMLANWEHVACAPLTVSPHISSMAVGPVEWFVYLKLDRNDVLSVIKTKLYNIY